MSGIGSRNGHYGKDPSQGLGGGLPGRALPRNPAGRPGETRAAWPQAMRRKDRAGGMERLRRGREVESSGQGKARGSIIETVVEMQLQAGYTVSPSGAFFTSPFFLLAALLGPEKSRLEKNSERNSNVTMGSVISEPRARDCEALGYEVAEGAPKNGFRYVGEQADPNSGFYYLRARWMDPKIGRLASVDAWDGYEFAPFTLHRYSYAEQSPISLYDPSGNRTMVQVSTALAVQGILQGMVTVCILSQKCLEGSAQRNSSSYSRPAPQPKSSSSGRDDETNRMGVGFQIGSDRAKNQSVDVLAFDNDIGVTKDQLLMELGHLYSSLNWRIWPRQLARWTAENVKKLEKKVRKSAPVSDIGNIYREETWHNGMNHRIDIDNWHGENLKE